MNRKDLETVAVRIAREQGKFFLTRKSLCEEVGIRPDEFRNVAGCQFIEFMRPILPLIEELPGYVLGGKQARAHAEVRQRHILKQVYKYANKRGLQGVNCNRAAALAGVSPSLVRYYFGGIDGLVAAVVVEGCEKKSAPIIVDALIQGFQCARDLPKKDRERALRTIARKAH